MTKSSKNRIANLDLFRAIAILFVIIFHVVQMFSGQSINQNWYAWGKYGVEFFFMLSGFLIGGLFYKQTKSVNLFRFWLLRFLRTYPPYFVALLVSFLTVLFARKVHFDPGYLIFIQNFYPKIPYFLISWSLCIEEHFYLLFPLLILVSEKLIKSAKGKLIFWIVLSITPTFCRYLLGSPENANFGYFQTASFFRFDGIAMGCLLAFAIYRMKYVFSFSIRSRLIILIFFICTILLNVLFKNHFLTYCFGYLILNISLLLLITTFYFSGTFRIASFFLVRPIASMAYSLYLTHAVVINAMSLISLKFHLSLFSSYFFTVVFIFITGFGFYSLIENPSIRFRDYYFKQYHDPIFSRFGKYLNFGKPPGIRETI